MVELIYSDRRMDLALAFCWETQRTLSTAKLYGWDNERIREYIKSRSQLWRRFPSGVRTSAHMKFLEELNAQLATAPEQRDKERPVWINERWDYGADARAQAARRTEPRPSNFTGDGPKVPAR
jgi:hypothetical protein